MALNDRGREDSSYFQLTLSPDVVVHALRLQRRRSLTFIGQRASDSATSDGDDDDDDGQAIAQGFTVNDASGVDMNPDGCSIC